MNHKQTQFDSDKYQDAVVQLLDATVIMEQQKELLKSEALNNPEWALEQGYLVVNFRLPPFASIARREVQRLQEAD